MKTIVVASVALLLSPILRAADYYVCPTGDDSNGCTNDGADCCLSLSRGAGLLSEGDSLKVMGGVYAAVDDSFVSGASGTFGSRITIEAHNGTPIFRTTAGGGASIITIVDDWWVVDGLHFEPTSRTRFEYGIILAGSYNEVRNCAMISNRWGSGAGGGDPTTWNVEYVWVSADGQFNYIHDNVIEGGGQLALPPGNAGGTIRAWGSFNRFENNIVNKGGHDNMSTYGGIGNEFIGNESVYSVGYGYFGEGGTGRTLLEGNSISGANRILNYVDGPLYFKSPNCVARYNQGYNTADYGADGHGMYGFDSEGVVSYVYNNVFYNNYSAGVHHFYGSEMGFFFNNVFAKNVQGETNSYLDSEFVVLGLSALTGGTRVHNNYIVRFSDGAWQDDAPDAVYYDSPATERSVSWMESNYPTQWAGNMYNYTGNDPRFVDPDRGDFALQPGSSLIGAGRWLTRTNGSNNDTSLEVDDAQFFWCSEFARNFGIPAGQTECDQVAIKTSQGVEHRTVTGISGNTLMVHRAITCVDDDEVTLYKSFRSSAVVLLSGFNPDVGVHEFTGSTTPTLPPSPPTGLRLR